MTWRQTTLTIDGDRFRINGEWTYKGRYWNGCRIEGLLMNSRMVQGIFDDKNPDTVNRWAYPDNGIWDPERNTREFIEHMPIWKQNGLLAVTVGLQGGSPEGYVTPLDQPYHNSAFHADGSLDEAYMARLKRIMDRADELGMVVILSYFYYGQEYRFSGDRAIRQAAANATAWVVRQGYRNVLIEIANECDLHYHTIIHSTRIHELIEWTQAIGKALRPECPLAVGTSFQGKEIPSDQVMAVSDFLLIHGNGTALDWIPQQAQMVRNRAAYRGQPIVNNEDDHYEFGMDRNHMVSYVKSGVSWGYYEQGESNYRDGYQSPPVHWGIDSEHKRGFFRKLKEITGADRRA